MSITTGKIDSKQLENNFAEIHPPLTASRAKIEADRCIYCYDAPCTKACPTSIDVPLFIKQIASDNIKGSATTIFKDNIFGGGCARVCPTEKLCEGACVCNELHEEPIPIGQLQRFATDKAIYDKWKLFDRAVANGKKVAVIGAGPAGLSCAHELSRLGTEVTVFEKEAQGGGLMKFGVAAYKLEPGFAEAEVDFITNLGGIDVKYNIELGKDISLEQLQKDYDAVFVGIGVGNARQLDIAGEDLEGVEDALSFIYDIRTKDYGQVKVGDKVAVIGMGMTAIDAATQSKRLGASEVTMVYRRSEAEMPCTEKELELAKSDECKIIWLASPKEVKGVDGKVSELICEVMKLGEPDESGRRRPEATGETFSLEVDMVIKAAGQLPYEEMVKEAGLDNKWGVVSLNDGSYKTNLDNIFAGGDCINGGKEVVNASEDGKVAAREILTHLGIKGN